MRPPTWRACRSSAPRCGPDFNQLSGEDITALGFNAHGGHGCISVTSNVAPRLCAEFQAACRRGDFAAALKLQDKLAPLHINLFVETSPAPVKYAMSLIGKCSEDGAAADGSGLREGARRGARGDGACRPDQLSRRSAAPRIMPGGRRQSAARCRLARFGRVTKHACAIARPRQAAPPALARSE